MKKAILAAMALLFAASCSLYAQNPNRLAHDSVDIANGAGGKVSFFYNKQLITSVPGGIVSTTIVPFIRACKAQDCLFEIVANKDDGNVSIGKFVLDTLYTGNITNIMPNVGTPYHFYLANNQLFVAEYK